MNLYVRVQGLGFRIIYDVMIHVLEIHLFKLAIESNFEEHDPRSS